MAAVKEFSVQEKLTTIIVLQKIDSKIDEINKLRGELPIEVKDLEDEIEGFNTRLKSIENEISFIEDDIKSKQNLQAECAESLKKYEKQQENVKNSREFEAINKEIELAELEIKACDKKIKDARVEIEEQNIHKNTTLGFISEKQEVLKIKQGELKKITEETEKEEEDLNIKRTSAAANVEPRLLIAYERIRGSFKNGLAVAAVERDSCGGCYNSIPPQRQSDIRLRKKMIVCEHCGRIMIDSELSESVSI
jgi:predicted  nucleic acid-binding Zn-ribbon protein